MRFDSADVAALDVSGRLESVFLHELLHVVGVGSLWDTFQLVRDAAPGDPVFSGGQALAALQGFDGGGAFAGVPVENGGGAGTARAHWRESVFGAELMTGFLSGGVQPLSRTTVGSLADLGYAVEPAAADPFTLGGSALLAADAFDGVELGDDVLRIPVDEVEPDRTSRSR
jgi:hypothetical protein